MRNPREATRFQNRKAARYSHDATFGIGDFDAASPVLYLTDYARNQDKAQRSPKPIQDVLVQPDQILIVADGRSTGDLLDVRNPGTITGNHKLDLAARLDKAQQRHYRQKQSEGEKHQRISRKPGPQPQREKKSDAAVRPGDRHEQRLADPVHRTQIPKRQHGFCV